MICTSYRGSIWHHGIKGQKWGVRHTKEELASQAHNSVTKPEENVILKDGYYESEKGFKIAGAKLSKYLLKPGQKHSAEFFGVGYSELDSEQLFRDIEECYDCTKKTDKIDVGDGCERYTMPMKLGVTDTAVFQTVWERDVESDCDRLLTAYIDRRLKERE